MLELGMRATVNSDDPAYFRAYMNENLRALREEGGLSKDELVQLVRNGFEVAWLDDARRRTYLERLDQHMRRAPLPLALATITQLLPRVSDRLLTADA